MFFVTLLLNQALAWMRAQPGTSSLRALLYMDEVFGYLPPTANPPSKKPFLTLLKQARAFGLGLVLATQNPVDLDYKALSNIGTWLLGRLQTERDVARVLDGLEGVAGSAFDRGEMSTLLAGLAARRFLLHNVHEEAPVLFETRWAMSYLAGPLTRDQIRRLRESSSAMPAAATSRIARGEVRSGFADAGSPGNQPPAATRPPMLPDGVEQRFLAASNPAAKPSAYSAGLLGEARIHYANAKAGWTTARSVLVHLPFESGAVDWAQASELEPGSTSTAPTAGDLPYGALPPEASRPKSYAAWKTALKESLARSRSLDLYTANGESSRPGESEAEFRARLALSARERRDEEVRKLRDKLDPRAATLRERLARAEAKVEEQRSQASARKIDTMASAAGAVFGALFGRRKLSTATFGRAASTVRSYSRQSKESRDVELAEESVEAIRSRIATLEEELGEATAALEARFDPAALTLERTAVKAKKADVEVLNVFLAWQPR